MGNRIDPVIQELLAREPEFRVSAEDLARWAPSDDAGRLHFFNEFAVRVAELYDQGKLSFEFCDILMNGLWGHVVTMLVREPKPDMPEPFYEVFCAFDAGEHYWTEDCSDNPVEERTNPAISRILAQQKSAS